MSYSRAPAAAAGHPLRAQDQVSTLAVDLPYAKAPREPLQLLYALAPAVSPQARLIGRLVATPTVDLSDYTCRAVVDWIELSVVLGRRTQFQYVQKTIEQAGLRRPYIRPGDPDRPNSTAAFDLKIQDPSPERLRRTLGALRSAFGLIDDPTVQGIEISVDFWPRTPSDAARHAIVAVLGRHLYPTRDIVTHGSDRPRYSAARGTSSFLVGDNRNAGSLDRLKSTEGDIPWPIDATLMIGRRGGAVQWKVMDKLLDSQRPDGTKMVLSDRDKRARIEVTLDRRELSRLGINVLGDMARASFTKLQGRFFRFMLATFGQPAGGLAAVGRYFEGLRYRRFSSAGVVGLVLMDAARDEHAKRNTGWLRRDFRSRRWTFHRRLVGNGVDQRYVAYRELNDRVSGALERLGKRWKEGGNHKLRGGTI